MGHLVPLAGKILVSAFLLYFTMHDMDFASVWARWRELDAVWLVPVVLLMTVQLVAAGWRWHMIGANLGDTTAFRRRSWIMLVSTFFNQTLPSFVGGDAMRIWLTRGQSGGVQVAFRAVLIDRGAGLLGILLLVALCLPGSWLVVGDATGRTVLAVIVGGGIAGAVLFFVCGQAARLGWPLWRPMRLLVDLAQSAGRVMLSPVPGLGIWVVSLLVHLMTVAIVLCLGWALDITLDPLMALYLIPPVILISFLPITVAGWGLREGAMITALSYVGIAATEALALSVLFGIAFLLQGILGGAAWLAMGAQRPKAAERDTVEVLASHAE